jgi:hypothetical protein
MDMGGKVERSGNLDSGEDIRRWSPTTRYEFGVQEENEVETPPPLPPPIQEICNNLKQEHDIAKAVKVDKAVVPVELWEKAVC